MAIIDDKAAAQDAYPEISLPRHGWLNAEIDWFVAGRGWAWFRPIHGFSSVAGWKVTERKSMTARPGLRLGLTSRR
jgi:hypothetical protein